MLIKTCLSSVGKASCSGARAPSRATPTRRGHRQVPNVKVSGHVRASEFTQWGMKFSHLPEIIFNQVTYM